MGKLNALCKLVRQIGKLRSIEQENAATQKKKKCTLNAIENAVSVAIV